MEEIIAMTIERVDPRSDSYSALLWDVVCNAHRYTPQPGDKVLDLGAHFGMFALYAAARGAQVDAYEPQPAIYAELCHTARVAAEIGHGHIIPHHAAIWSHSTVLELNRAKDGTTATASAIRPQGDREAIRVRAEAFDGLMFQDWDCLKMDVEGAEHEILITSQRLDRIGYLTVEIHNDILSSQQTREIYEVLRKSFPVVTCLPRKEKPEEAVAYFCRR